MEKGSKWAILIGINRYHESLGSLKYACADCRALRDTLISSQMGFPEDQVLLLDDQEAAEHLPTFANIHSFLGSWLSAPKKEDLVLVYFAGHGRLADGKMHLVPSDATLSSLHTLGIPLQQVQDVIERCKSERKLLVLDACHSGAGRDICVMTGGMQRELASGTGFYTISSCGPDELSHEWDKVGHGVFSHFLSEGLKGGCSIGPDGRLTVDRLYEWVHERVAKWAAQHRCSQTPQRFSKGSGTIVLAQSAPDHAAMAEQYRREAEEAKARLAEMEARETKERLADTEKRKLHEAMTEDARKFLAENPKLTGAALFVKWRKHARKHFAEIAAMVDVDKVLFDEREKFFAGRVSNVTVKGNLRLVVVPPGVKTTIYINDELAGKSGNVFSLPAGRHELRVIPENMEWGTSKHVVAITPGKQERIVIRLRRSVSKNALLSFLAVVLWGLIVALPGFLLIPVGTGLDIFSEVNLGAYSRGIFFSFPISIVNALILGGIVASTRGLVLGHECDFLSLRGMLLAIQVVVCTIAAWAFGYILLLRHVFVFWALGTSLLAGILFCLVPWHGQYKNRDVL
jgi:uncharacterized caspase-like protein